MDTLSLREEHKIGTKDGTTTVDRNYIDFVISGKSLRQILGETDRIGVFGWSVNADYEIKKINTFLGLEKPELTTGRSEFYVCAECGDIGCGAITAIIEITPNTVIWKDFGYENNYEEPTLEAYKNVGPFVFDKALYFTILEKIKDRN